MTRHRRGFTLLELLFAISLSAIIVTAAVGSTMPVVGRLRETAASASLHEDAKLLVDFLASYALEAGGGGIIPPAAVAIENAASCAARTLGTITVPACSGTDRLMLLALDDGAPVCSIDSSGGTSASAVDVQSAPCCLVPAEWTAKSFVMVSADLTRFESRLCTLATSTASSCRCTTPPSGVAPSLPSPATGPVDYGGGLMFRGRSMTFFVNPASRRLQVLTDDDVNGVAEVVDLAGDVYDFQVQAGLDLDDDGVVETWGDEQLPSTLNRNQLRQLRIGVVVGEAVPGMNRTTTARIAWAAPITGPVGVALAASFTTITFRNQQLFQ